MTHRSLLVLPSLLVGACLSLSDVEEEKKKPVPLEDASGVIDVYTSDVGLYCEAGKKICKGACVPYDDPAYGCAATGCAPCDLPGATVICQNLGCKLTACLPGFQNCDGNEANGCEIDLTTDLANCGACGTVCGSDHATATCTNGICGAECDSEYGNCNSQAADGCETPLATTANCGGCGVTCANGFVCASGSCRCNADPDCTGGTLQNMYGNCNDAGICDCDNGQTCSAGKKCSNSC